jgi:hypothetical protein
MFSSNLVPNLSEPALPGAMNKLLHFGDCAIFQEKAFSRPPEPKIRIFTFAIYVKELLKRTKVQLFFLKNEESANKKCLISDSEMRLI